MEINKNELSVCTQNQKYSNKSGYLGYLGYLVKYNSLNNSIISTLYVHRLVTWGYLELLRI